MCLGQLEKHIKSCPARYTRIHSRFLKKSLQPSSKRQNFHNQERRIPGIHQECLDFPRRISKARKPLAPYPLELPRRLIQLYAYAGDIVLDPFIGSGTTPPLRPFDQIGTTWCRHVKRVCFNRRAPTGGMT